MPLQKAFRCSIRTAFPLLWMLGLAAGCFGQFETAAVLGGVYDQRAGAIQQARVALENTETGTSQTAVTDAN